MSKTNSKMEEQKVFIIKELGKLESMKWAKDKEVSHAIFPYVLVEAINLLMNSKIVENPVDYTSTSEEVERLLLQISKL